MRNVKLVSILFVLFLFVKAPTLFGQDQGEVVYIEIWEAHKKFSKMVVITPNDEVEVTPLEGYRSYLDGDEKGNGFIVKKELTRWIKQGFDVKTSFSRLDGTHSMYTIILTKN